MVLLRQGAQANLDEDTILRYDPRQGLFQSQDPQLDEMVWTSPVWVTRAAP